MKNDNFSLGENLVTFAKQVEKQRKIDFIDVITAIEEALAVIVRRYSGAENERIYRVKLDPETGDINIYRCWRVVNDVQYPTKEITLEAAKLDDPEIKVGDMIEDLQEDQKDIQLDRIGLASFKQMVQTKLRVLEKRRIVRSYIPVIGQIIKGTVRKSTAHKISVTITEYGIDQSKFLSHNHDAEAANETNSIEAFINKRDMIGEERFRPNAEIRALLVSVEDKDSPSLQLSRTDDNFMRRLCEREIPEIRNGIIEIVDLKRIPGSRCKVVVRTNDPKIDLIGACIGPKSSRHNAISAEVKSERVDFIKYDEDLAQYVKNVLCQQVTEQIIIDEKRRIVDVSVRKDLLGQTIGQSGNNVRLAKLITGWTVRVYDTEEFNKIKAREDARYASLFENALGLDTESANFLVGQGFTKIEELAAEDVVEDLKEYLDEQDAQMLNNLAIEYLQRKQQENIDLIYNSNIDKRLLQLSGIDNNVLVKFIKHNIKTLEDLADLAADELAYIDNYGLAQKLIMEARQICWFNDSDNNSVENQE